MDRLQGWDRGVPPTDRCRASPALQPTTATGRPADVMDPHNLNDLVEAVGHLAAGHLEPGATWPRFTSPRATT